MMTVMMIIINKSPFLLTFKVSMRVTQRLSTTKFRMKVRLNSLETHSVPLTRVNQVLQTSKPTGGIDFPVPKNSTINLPTRTLGKI